MSIKNPKYGPGDIIRQKPKGEDDQPYTGIISHISTETRGVTPPGEAYLYAVVFWGSDARVRTHVEGDPHTGEYDGIATIDDETKYEHLGRITLGSQPDSKQYSRGREDGYDAGFAAGYADAAVDLE